MVEDYHIQENILRVVIDKFRNKNCALLIIRNVIIENVTKELPDVTERDVKHNLRQLYDDSAIDIIAATGINFITLKPRGIEMYEKLSGDVVVPESDIKVVFKSLYNEERGNPSVSQLSRDELIEQTELSERQLDRAVWYMKEKNWIDLLTNIGYPWWHSAEISSSGRSIYESL